MLVKFTNVGRAKKTWSEELPDLEWATLFRAVRMKRALGSREIDFSGDEEKGNIYVGGVRKVGRWEVVR